MFGEKAPETKKATMNLSGMDAGVKEGLKARCSQVFFRQSMINDLMMCPKMAMFRWVMNLEETSPYMAAVLGTAGHEVIFLMHLNNRFEFTQMQMLELFERCFNKALESLTSLPVIGKNYGSIREEFQARSFEYVEMLMTYAKHEKTTDFKSTMHEQAFVLEVVDPEFPLEKPFLFTGQLDQGGVYESDGVYALRDIKFRDSAFKPDYKAFNFNPQMTVYSAAMKYGNPACQKCKPHYIEDNVLGSLELVYDGPCEDCRKKIGTPLWPQVFPERCELVWMKDFLLYKRKYKDKNAGDMKGPGYIYTYRPPQRMHVLMHDVISICREVRNGSFHRKPGEHCGLWCKYYEQCKNGIECDADTLKDATLIKSGIYSDDDPF